MFAALFCLGLAIGFIVWGARLTATACKDDSDNHTGDDDKPDRLCIARPIGITMLVCALVFCMIPAIGMTIAFLIDVRYAHSCRRRCMAFM